MKRISKKIIVAAIIAEIVLITTGLALATSFGIAAFEEHGQLTLALSAAAFPILLAILEVFKTPAGIALYQSAWFVKPFALAALLAGMMATAETTTMAGTTWFKAIQFQVTSAQAELDNLVRSREVLGEGQNELVEARREAVESIRDQLGEVSIEEARAAARERFALEWERQSQNNERRAQNENDAIRREAERSQASLPSLTNYVAARMAEWEATDAKLISGREDAAENLRQQLLTANAALADAQNASRQVAEKRAVLDAEIAQQRLTVASLAQQSVVYDLSSKFFEKPLAEVTEAEANKVTKWVIGAVAVAAAMATGIAAFLAAHLSGDPKRITLAQSLRKYSVMRRWKRKQTIVKTEYVDRVVYKVLPHPESITELNRPVLADLFDTKGKSNAA